MDFAEQLEGLERCSRIPFWGRSWHKNKIAPEEMLHIGVRAGLMEKTRKDIGNVAGEELYALAATREIESKQHDLHAQVVHLSAIADIATTAIRRPSDGPWQLPEPLETWNTSAYLSPDGNYLRRVVFVTSWSPDRHYSLCRAWSALGDVCHYGMPMQLAVVMLGKHQDGRYRSFWTRALQHPVNKKLRFRKKHDVANGFKASWNDIYREDHDEYPTQQWLQAMLEDGVLQDVLFKIDVPVPDKLSRQRIIDLAKKKMDRIDSMKSLPLQNLSTCHWPRPCVHNKHCLNNEEPSGRYGFVPVESLR